MHGWSYESGFPLVRVTLGGITNRDVSLSQVWGSRLLTLSQDAARDLATAEEHLAPCCF